MEQHPLLATFAGMAARLGLTRQMLAPDQESLRQVLAQAVLQEQPAVDMADTLRFEHLESFGQAEEAVLNALNEALKIDSGTADASVRIFKRTVPFRTSRVPGSSPPWALGAEPSEVLGPFLDDRDRWFWIDIFRTIPAVRIYLQGDALPVLILPIQIFLLFQSRPSKKFAVPSGSVWIRADLIASDAPDNLYCGLRVRGGELTFGENAQLQADRSLVVPPGATVTLSLKTRPAEAEGEAPEGLGQDALKAELSLPDNLTLEFHQHGYAVREAGQASWNVYGQADRFYFQPQENGFFEADLNRACIPFQSEVGQLNVAARSSKVFSLKGKAVVEQVAWSFQTAQLDVFNPLEAAGAGAMMVRTGEGLSGAWPGLKDANLKAPEPIQLRRPWILHEPGRLAVSDRHAGQATARQLYRLWDSEPGKQNTLLLDYADVFPFLYNCLQIGNESVWAFADCTGTIDRPVDASGQPFSLHSRNTWYLLTVSPALPLVALYDDNLLFEQGPAGKKPVFKSHALALNNALFTVTPIAGFFLFGLLDGDDRFRQAQLLFSFGLLSYLPTLPDPYAANLGALKRQFAIRDDLGRYRYAEDVRMLLLAGLNWEQLNIPQVRFQFGQAAAQLNRAAAGATTFLEAEDPELQHQARAARTTRRFRDATRA